VGGKVRAGRGSLIRSLPKLSTDRAPVIGLSICVLFWAFLVSRSVLFVVIPCVLVVFSLMTCHLLGVLVVLFLRSLP